MKGIFLSVILLAVHTYSFGALVITSTAALSSGASMSWTTLDINEAHRNESACDLYYCKYGIMMRYWGSLALNGAVSPFNNVFSVGIKNGTTWAEAQAVFTQRFGRSGSNKWTSWTWHPTKWEVCVGRMPSLPVSPASDLVLQNPSDCSLIPPISVSCSVKNKVDIDHGTLSASAVHGAKGTAVANLSCTSRAKVRVRFLPRIVKMGGGITSTISIDEIQDGDVIDVDSMTNLTFVSQLSSSGATIGAHQGSSVVIFDII